MTGSGCKYSRKLKNLAKLLSVTALIFALFFFSSWSCEQQHAFDGPEMAALRFADNATFFNMLTSAAPSYGAESNGIFYYMLLHYNMKYNGISNIDKIADSNKPGRLIQGLTDAEILKLRSLSLVFWFLSAYLIFAIGNKLGGSKCGILSLLYYSFCGTVLSVSSYCRFYQLDIFCSSLASYLLLILMETKRERLLAVLYILAMSAAISSMSMSVFLLPVHALHWIICRKSKRILAWCMAVPISVFLILWKADSAAILRKGGYFGTQLELIPKYILWIFGIESDAYLADWLMPSMPIVYSAYKIYLCGLFVIAAFISLACLVKYVQRWIFIKKIIDDRGLVFFALWTFVPLGIILAVSFCWADIVNKHNLCFICPGTALFIGACLSRIPRKLTWLALTFTALSAPLYLPVCVYETLGYNFKLALYLKEHMKPGDILISRGEFTKALYCSGLPPVFSYVAEDANINDYLAQIDNNNSFNENVLSRLPSINGSSLSLEGINLINKNSYHIWLWGAETNATERRMEKYNLKKLASEGAEPCFSLTFKDCTVTYLRVISNR